MLHIIYKSPSESQSWENCLAAFSSQDVILFIENGVFCALLDSISGNQFINLAEQGKVFLLAQHAIERGVLYRLIDGLQSVDFDGFVNLTIEHYPILRW